MVASSRESRSPLLFATFFPVRPIGQVRPHEALGILDDAAAVHTGQSGERFGEVPVRPGMRMLLRFHRAGFGKRLSNSLALIARSRISIFFSE